MSTNEIIPPPYVSPSSISTFQQCPLKYKYSRIDKLDEDPTEATLKGNFVHDILEEVYKLDAEQRTMANARRIARDLWDERWGEQMCRWLPASALHSVRWSAWWCVENLWDLEDPSKIEPTGIEFDVEVRVSGVAVKGFIDRWGFNEDGTITVTDYKTGKTPRKQYQDDKYFQLFVYAVALQELGVGEVSHIELLFLKDGQRLKKKSSPNDIQQTIDTLVEVRQAIETSCQTGHFDTRPSRLCDWCSFKSICPYWSK